MNIKTIMIALLIILIGGFCLFRTNKGGNNMVEANQNHKVLVAYFSRAGEQYGVGNVKEGNTAVIAKMIAQKTGGDLYEIKPVKDEYPNTYRELTAYSKAEQQRNARPEIVGHVANFDQYDTVFLGYPIWWGDKPMPVYTFLESYNFKGKTLIPFATHEGSGLVGTGNLNKTGAHVLKGFGIYGHTAQNNKAEADKFVTEKLKELGY